MNQKNKNKNVKLFSSKKDNKENQNKSSQIVKRSYHDEVINIYKKKLHNSEERILVLQKELDDWKNKYETFAHSLESRFQSKMEEMNLNSKKTLQDELKRVSSEIEKKINKALSNIFKDIAEQILNISYTVINIPENSSSELQNYSKGFQMLIKQLEKILIMNGLQIIYPKINDLFNPNSHYAISKVYSEENVPPQGVIIEVVSPQYLLNDKTISYANVKVAIKK